MEEDVYIPSVAVVVLMLAGSVVKAWKRVRQRFLKCGCWYCVQFSFHRCVCVCVCVLGENGEPVVVSWAVGKFSADVHVVRWEGCVVRSGGYRGKPWIVGQCKYFFRRFEYDMAGVGGNCSGGDRSAVVVRVGV